MSGDLKRIVYADESLESHSHISIISNNCAILLLFLPQCVGTLHFFLGKKSFSRIKLLVCCYSGRSVYSRTICYLLLLLVFLGEEEERIEFELGIQQ